MTVTANGRTADHDIDPLLLQRWSPRAFTGEAMPQDAVMALFDAARWAPSAFNAQPWRFVYAHRDTPEWEPLFGLLMPMNQAWAKNASVLIFLVSDRFRRAEGQPPAPQMSHTLDAGAAWSLLALQATRSGWAAHGMLGFNHTGAYEVLGVDPEQYKVEAAIAVGRQADPSVLDEAYRAREVPTGRNPLASFVFKGRLGG